MESPSSRALEGVVGHAHIKTLLIASLENNSPVHLLLYGPSGVGKSLIAHKYAAAILRLDPLVASGSVAVSSVWPKRVLEVEEEHMDIEFLRSTTLECFMKQTGWRVVIYDPADGLTTESQNHLRGVLEHSATERICWIFVFSTLDKVAAPLRSRCLDGYCAPLRHDETVAYLESLTSLDFPLDPIGGTPLPPLPPPLLKSNIIEQVSREAHGNVQVATHLFRREYCRALCSVSESKTRIADKVHPSSSRLQAENILLACILNDHATALKHATEFATCGYTAHQFILCVYDLLGCPSSGLESVAPLLLQKLAEFHIELSTNPPTSSTRFIGFIAMLSLLEWVRPHPMLVTDRISSITLPL